MSTERDQTPWPPNRWPTPDEWRAWFTGLDAEQQRRAAERIMEGAERGSRCFLMNHERRLDRLEIADVGAEVAAVRDALLTSRLTWGTHGDRWGDVEWQREFWTEAAEIATTALAPLIAVRVEAAKAEAWDEAHAELCDYALAERGVITPLHRQNPYRAFALDPGPRP